MRRVVSLAGVLVGPTGATTLKSVPVSSKNAINIFSIVFWNFKELTHIFCKIIGWLNYWFI